MALTEDLNAPQHDTQKSGRPVAKHPESRNARTDVAGAGAK
jgi:hypothetical protein